MTTLSVTIPDAVAQRVVNSLCYQYGYKDHIPNPDNPNEWIPNPITKAQFAKNCVKAFLKDAVIAYEANLAAETARVAASNAAGSEIDIGD